MSAWDWDEFLAQALKAGLSVAEFWEMTPLETRLALEARVWQMERAQEQRIRLAWLTAALVRVKRMPAANKLMAARPARPLHGEEAVRRRAEFRDLARKIDVDVLSRKRRQ